MRWFVISIEDRNHDPEEAADLGHALLLSQTHRDAALRRPTFAVSGRRASNASIRSAGLRGSASQREQLGVHGTPEDHGYSITLLARTRNDGGSVRPRARAVLRFTVSEISVGCSTGRSAGFAPFKILSTYTAARCHDSRMSGP